MEMVDDMRVKVARQHVSIIQLPSDASEQRVFTALTMISSNISRLSSEDADLFRNEFQQEESCYSNSWLYILRATRNDEGGFGYKFVAKDTLIGIGYRNNTFYLVHPMGRGRFRTTLNLCTAIATRLRCPIVLKKVDRELYTYLAASGLFEEYSDGQTLFEEEAFPEHILPLQTLYDPQVGVYNQGGPFMRKVKRFAKSAMTLQPRFDIAEIENNPGFHTLFGGNVDKYRSYLNIIREVQRQQHSGKYKLCNYCDEDGASYGLYISEFFGKGQMGLYCAVSAKAFPGMTEWMDYDFFRQLYLAGIETLYLGGSETAGVDAYVKKLHPITPTYFTRPIEFCLDRIDTVRLNGIGADD